MTSLFKIVLVAISLALDVFAVSVGVGIRGIPRSLRLRIGAAFACAEVSMNLVGAGLGAVAGRLIGPFAGYVGFVALIGVGVYILWEAREREEEAERLDLARGWGLFLASLSISLDSLGIGFSILYIGVPLGLALAVIAVVSVASTTLGLALGHTLGKRVEDRAEHIAGVVLILTGLIFILNKAFNIG